MKKILLYILTLGIIKWIEIDKKLEVHIASSTAFKEAQKEVNKNINKKLDILIEKGLK